MSNSTLRSSSLPYPIRRWPPLKHIRDRGTLTVRHTNLKGRTSSRCSACLSSPTRHVHWMLLAPEHTLDAAHPAELSVWSAAHILPVPAGWSIARCSTRINAVTAERTRPIFNSCKSLTRCQSNPRNKKKWRNKRKHNSRYLERVPETFSLGLWVALGK